MIMNLQTTWSGWLPDSVAGSNTDLIIGLLAFVVSALIAILWLAIRRQTNSDEFKTSLDFHLQPEQVFALCLASLQVLRRYKIQCRNEKEGKLVVRLPFTWVSTGETITFQMTNGRDGLTSLSIVSTPIVPCPVGNFQSDEKILGYLRNHTEVIPQDTPLAPDLRTSH